jgi:hypothetical protein
MGTPASFAKNRQAALTPFEFKTGGKLADRNTDEQDLADDPVDEMRRCLTPDIKMSGSSPDPQAGNPRLSAFADT